MTGLTIGSPYGTGLRMPSTPNYSGIGLNASPALLSSITTPKLSAMGGGAAPGMNLGALMALGSAGQGMLNQQQQQPLQWMQTPMPQQFENAYDIIRRLYGMK